MHSRDEDDLAEAMAADPRTSPAELTRLAGHHDLDVRRRVLANPSTPRAIIDAALTRPTGTSLWEAAVDAAMSNASLPLWLLADPDWLRRQDWSTALRMARSPALTLAGWEALAGHASDRMSAALMSSPAAPVDAWRRCGFASELDALRAVLEDSEDDTVVQILVVDFLEHPGLAARLRDEPDWLRRDTPRATRALAGSRVLTPTIWQALCGHPDERTRLALLRSPLAPADAWAALGLPSSGTWDLSEAGLEGDDLRDLARRPQLAGLTGLSVWSDDRGAIADLLRSPFLTGLTSLAMPQFRMNLPVLEALSEGVFRDQLTSLELPYNGLGDLDSSALAPLGQLGALVSLDLSHNRLTDGYMEDLFTEWSFASLTSLDLEDNELTIEAMEWLYVWAAHARPTRLNLAENRLGDAGVVVLARSASFATLTSLDIHGTGMTREGAEALARSTTLSSLTSLTLRDNALGDRAVMALARSAALSRLTRLDLTSTKLGPPSAAALAGSTTLACLSSLSLSQNPLGDEGVSALCWSPFLTGLRSLRLDQTGMGAAGMAALAQASVLAGLTSLDLSGNPGVDDACMTILGQARWSRELTSLLLSDTSVGDDGLEALACSNSFPRLEVLELSYVTTQGLLALARSPSLPCLRELRLESGALNHADIAVLASVSFRPVQTPDSCQLLRRDLSRALSTTAPSDAACSRHT